MSVRVSEWVGAHVCEGERECVSELGNRELIRLKPISFLSLNKPMHVLK